MILLLKAGQNLAISVGYIDAIIDRNFRLSAPTTRKGKFMGLHRGIKLLSGSHKPKDYPDFQGHRRRAFLCIVSVAVSTAIVQDCRHLHGGFD